jgi:hypothetical protein
MTSDNNMVCGRRFNGDEGIDKKECVARFLRINPSEICFVKYIFEGYDGLAVLTTMDAVKGIVTLYVAPGREAEAEQVLVALAKSIRIETLMEPGIEATSPSGR